MTHLGVPEGRAKYDCPPCPPPPKGVVRGGGVEWWIGELVYGRIDEIPLGWRVTKQQPDKEPGMAQYMRRKMTPRLAFLCGYD